MTGEERRGRLLELLGRSAEPVSGARLGRELGVSRQIVVQDIALLRSAGADIVSTSRGYLYPGPDSRPSRTFKVRHRPADTADELTCIVDRGGRVEDVTVNHRTYGRISAPLGIGSRSDIERFMAEIKSGASSLLMVVTDGYHFHRVSADTEDVLDDVEAVLGTRGYLAARLPYERDL